MPQEMQAKLSAVLADVTEAAYLHRKHLVKNESATRTTLIDPVLRALGWEVADPRLVVWTSPSNADS